MVATQPLSVNDLLDHFKTCSRLQFNGKLEIKSQKGQQWSFYYRLGRIVCATGGIHSVRRWRRQIMKVSPTTDVKDCQFRESDLELENWDYQILKILRQRQEINMDQIAVIVEGTISELVFDVIQAAELSSLSCNRNEVDILDSPLSLSRRGLFVKQIEQEWPAWCKSGLKKISPNLAPVIANSQELKSQVSPTVYKNLIRLLNGNATVRDLAVKMKQDVRQLTRSLIPYHQKKLIEWHEIPDLPMPTSYDSAASTYKKAERRQGALVACVDDSPQVCQAMEQILTSGGYHCLAIQNSLNALPTLIERKPALIFLDLVMPVANGYEICSQLRRISSFANTPILILTGNDSLVDRVRAKLVGASGFVSKPIQSEKILSIVQKHLANSVSAQDSRTSEMQLPQSTSLSLLN